MTELFGTELFGTVVRGEGYGRKLGFPTVNLDRRQWARQKLTLRDGVYAGIAVLPGGKARKAGIVIGPRDNRGLPKLEAHILGFRGNLYGQRVLLRLVRYLRPFRRYTDETELIQAIRKDVAWIRRMRLVR